jgi:hypothetical protein
MAQGWKYYHNKSVKLFERHFEAIKSFLTDTNYIDISCLEIDE